MIIKIFIGNVVPHIMAMNGAYKKLIHYCPNRLLAIKQLGKKMNVIYSLKGINRVKILQSVNDLFLQIDD